MSTAAEMASTKEFLFGSTAVLTILSSYIFGNSLNSKTTFFIAFCIFLFHLLALAAYHAIIYPKFLSPFRKLPSPPNASFFLGHGLEMMKELNVPVKSRSWAEIPNDGALWVLDVFNVERLFLTSPAAFAEVLVHKCYDYEKPDMFRRSSKRIVGDGILFAEGDVHKGQRKAFMPVFSFRQIKNLYPLFWSKCATLVQELDRQEMEDDDCMVVEVNTWASKAALDIIGEAALGLDLQVMQDDGNALSQTYRAIFAPGKMTQVLALANLILPSWLVYNLPVKYNQAAKENADIINRTCRKQLDTFRKLQEKNETPTNILTTAMSSQHFTDDELVQQITTFLVAGHETTATALTWAIYLLCKHPEMQVRLRTELHTSTLPSPRSSSSTAITAAQIDSLPYLNAICAETLRIYPPVPATIRQAVRPTTIGDLPIPKGMLVMMAPWVINASTVLWGPTAREFDPERWLRSADGGVQSNYANLTFLHGPRSCIGERFARAEMACLLAAWVGAFEIKLQVEEEEGEEVGVQMAAGITAKPRGGVWVSLRPVEWKGEGGE